MMRMKIGVEARSPAFGSHFPHQSRLGQRMEVVVNRGARGPRIAPIDGFENFLDRGVNAGVREIPQNRIALRRRTNPRRAKSPCEFWDQIRQNLNLE